MEERCSLILDSPRASSAPLGADFHGHGWHGTYDNQGLSERRAKRVKQWLIQNAARKDADVIANGHGKRLPPRDRLVRALCGGIFRSRMPSEDVRVKHHRERAQRP